ncbi:hypothetical protein [Herbidospora mongoliensis]|uniref:hypothetical protein n=1 Tax=Herbidospora mongoliensis TaxID=688067 RepID=UPI000A540873|nr:hypothetical protein [Herbidospora mongoliensis]
MSRRSEAYAAVSNLWGEHLAAPLPIGLRFMATASGEPVAYLDAVIAGCVSAYVQNEGDLDVGRIATLSSCAHELRALHPGLRGENAGYVLQLIQTADVILGTLDTAA